MKILDIIRASNLLENNEIRIEEVTYKKISNELNVSFVLAKAVSFSTYEALCELIYSSFKKLNVKVQLLIGYEDDTLTEEEYKEYLKHILGELGQNSPRYQSINIDQCKIEDKEIVFYVAYDALGIDGLCKPIISEFEKYGIEVNISVYQDENISVQAQIDELDKQIFDELDRQQQEAKAASKFNAETKKINKDYKNRNVPTKKTPIRDIPASLNELSIFTHENGYPTFLIDAYVFGIEVKKFDKTKSLLATIKVTDDTDSIIVKKWLRSENEKELYETEIKNDTLLRIIGTAQFDNFSKDIVLMASSIEILGVRKEEEVMDNSTKKRVELHIHTKMSTLDGISDAKEYIKLAKKWGWKAIAVTDHNGVYSIPEICHSLDEKDELKPIYGVELSYVDDSKYFITFDERDIDLKKSAYVVYDIETTGLSQTYDRIIEIAACKVYQGGIIETFETFVNPQRSIPKKISALTTITEEMVQEAPTIEEVLPKFMEFCKDCILVAHNAQFDVGFIYANVKRLNLEYPILPAIDTLNLFRAGYHNEVKKFNLKSMSKYFKVKQEQHHRAIDDTRVTALCFIGMLNDLYAKNITNYKDINSLIDPLEHWKYVIPPHINILAMNPVGFKNLYKLVSDALTNHFNIDARALKSVIAQYREGLLLGSGCANGEVFETALLRSEEELHKVMRYYDYIEVQPPLAYAHLFSSFPNGQGDIEEVISKIIRIAKEENKLVVATSDCHYTRPKLKKYRDIMIQSPQIGGGQHRLAEFEVSPSMHLRTTEEMLEEFSFLDKDLAYEIVVTNTNSIADKIEAFPAFKKEMFAPKDDEFKDSILHIPSIVEEVRRIVKENVEMYYGENPHGIVKDRIERELNSIISNGYASVYYMAHLMVVKSVNDGYLVGSRGSVGSSFAATMMDITEINPLAPHYRCKKCKFHAFRMTEEEKKKYGVRDIEIPLQDALNSVDTGYDLPDAVCPVCGEKLSKDGHDIPFETFLGFDGDKVPDIDLNFSGEYQAKAHEYIREVFGVDNAFRGGTVGTIAEKNAYGYVKGYCERTGVTLRSCEIERIAQNLIGIKRSTGQHPGGIIVVPHYVDIYDVTPIQYPADKITNSWRTTHYDYHSFEDNLLKLDVLGHDDPTLIKYLMDYVHEHQDQFPFSRPQDIPIDDKKLYKLFNSTEIIGVTEEQINSKVASYAVPELGTNFVQKILVETLPKTFAQLVKISGLSHGTDVWKSNAQDLVAGKIEKYGTIEFKDIIGCRDDIMVDLMHMGLEPLKAFKIMEFVRKGKASSEPAKWAAFRKEMEEKNVPQWYIWSCEKIKYMFPKAHATAYVLMALRLAWFKVYSPSLFYSAWFSKRAKSYNIQAFLGGPIAIKARLSELNVQGILDEDGPNSDQDTSQEDDATTTGSATEKAEITALQVALEMTSRGIKFLPVDIFKSSATTFELEDGNLRLPFIAVDKLGASVAQNIVEKRNEKLFTSKKDVAKRTRLNSTLFEEFEIMHSFGNLPDEDKEETEGIFAFA